MILNKLLILQASPWVIGMKKQVEQMDTIYNQLKFLTVSHLLVN